MIDGQSIHYSVWRLTAKLFFSEACVMFKVDIYKSNDELIDCSLGGTGFSFLFHQHRVLNLV